MERRRFLRGGLALVGGLVAGPMINRGHFRLFADRGPRISGRAIDVVERTTVIDMLGLLTLDWSLLYRWQQDPGGFTETDFRHLRASGVDVFHPAVETNSPHPERAVVRWLKRWDALVRHHRRFFQRIDLPEHLEAGARGKVGILVGFQNSDHFRAPPDVGTFYRLGQRVSQLTYNGRNRLGSGCLDPDDRGLTPFGIDLVAAMNEVGMVIDVSHCGERTSLDACAASSRPVLVTHANCRALVPGQPRCKTDQAIQAMAATGGVMGITAVRSFVSAKEASLRDLLDHFDHVTRLVGVEHVGLGSDTDVDARPPGSPLVRPPYQIRGLHHPLRVYQITDGLLRRGYREADVELILGGNFERALRSIWTDTCATGASPRTPSRRCPSWQRDPFLPPPGL